MWKRTEKKSILIVLYYYYPYVSGLSNYAKILAEAMVERGFAVTVLSTQYQRGLPRKEQIKGVEIIRVPVYARFGKGVIAPSFSVAIVRLAREFDIVNFHLPMAEAGLSSLFIDRRKVITTYHCDLNLGKGLLNHLIENVSFALMRLALSRSRSIVANSVDYFAHCGMKQFIAKVIEMPPPVRVEQFFRTDNYHGLMSKFKIRPNAFKIGFVGRLVSEKGIQYLLEAIPALSDRINDFVIIIAGEARNVAGGTVAHELEKYCSLYPGRIVFTGFLSEQDLLRFYNMIDVLVLPSIDPLESFGIVQIEAMLCGTPVVASDMPGIRSVILQTGFGVLAEPKNSDDLARKIADLFKKKIFVDRVKMQKFYGSQSLDNYERLFNAFSSPHV